MPRKKRSASPFELMDDDFDDTSSQSSRNGNPPIQRNAANARERARMRVLSSAFGRLKTKLPNIPADTKLSKLDTLRLATMYIKQLKSVVEGGAPTQTTNGDTIGGSLNLNSIGNGPTNCYLHLHGATQSMNWPFGFHHQHHHHLSNSALIRSTSSLSLTNNSNSSNNWCVNDNNNNIGDEQQINKHSHYDTENYQQGKEQQNHLHQLQPQPNFVQQTTLGHQQNNQHNHHWYSETPSPELDTTTNACLSFDNAQLQQQQQQHQQSEQHHHLHHHHQQQPNLTHLPPATSTHSSTFHLPHDFHHHQLQLQQHQATHHLQNGFGNSSNFQATSIR